MSGDLIFDPLWEAVARLERIGVFFVLAVCCDRASTNRKLWKLYSEKNELLYKISGFLNPLGVAMIMASYVYLKENKGTQGFSILLT